ncbi:MAG: hypothetical protein ACI9VR_003830 [Cognaticolwellia sp.]|jgi:hypothetical protein
MSQYSGNSSTVVQGAVLAGEFQVMYGLSVAEEADRPGEAEVLGRHINTSTQKTKS